MTASHIRICSIDETMLYGFPNSANFCPDYVGHESSEEFWKNIHFKNMRADFLRRCQNSLRQTCPEMMHFQA